MDERAPAMPQKKVLLIGGLVLTLALLWIIIGLFSGRSPFDTLTSQMETALRKGQYDTALQKGQERVSVAATSFGESSPQLIDALHDLGSVYAAQKNYEQASPWFERSVAAEIK